jgi:photoactive yellow protein
VSPPSERPRPRRGEAPAAESTPPPSGDVAPPPGPALAELGLRIDDLDASALDEHPFGIIRLDAAGRVLSYNVYEERLARRSRHDVVGKNFFFDVAPCTRVRRFYGRFVDGVARRSLRATFGFVFAFAHGERAVEVTLFYRESEDAVWVLVRG